MIQETNALHFSQDSILAIVILDLPDLRECTTSQNSLDHFSSVLLVVDVIGIGIPKEMFA